MKKEFIKITLIKSLIGLSKKKKLILLALGLNKIGKKKIFKLNKSFIGMFNKINYLVKSKKINVLPGKK